MENQQIEREFLQLERQFWQAMKDRDAETAGRLADETCIVTGAQGVGRIDREQLKTMVKSASYTLREFELKDARVQMLSDDVAIVAYMVHEELTVDGESVALDAAESSAWIRRAGKWQCALHTESIAGDPFGRDRQA